MCSPEKEGRGNEWDVIIPFPSPKTECLKATGPLQPLYLNPRGAFTTLAALYVSNDGLCVPTPHRGGSMILSHFFILI